MSDDEVKKIEEASSKKELGDIGRDKVATVILGGEAPEIGNVKAIYTEVPILGEGGVRPKKPKKVDLVIEMTNSRFIVIEVETTRNLNSLWDRFWQGVKQLSDDYMEPIKEYGLDLGGGRFVKDIDAYYVFALYFDIQNKIAKVMHGRLPQS